MLRDSRGGRVRPDDDRQGNQEEPDRLQGRFQGAEQDLHALVKKKWTQAERLLATPLICSAQWPEALASSTSPCIGRG